MKLTAASLANLKLGTGGKGPRSPVPRAAKEIKRDPSLPLLQKSGAPVPESHKNRGPCFTSPKNAVILLFLDLFRLLWR